MPIISRSEVRALLAEAVGERIERAAAEGTRVPQKRKRAPATIEVVDLCDYHEDHGGNIGDEDYGVSIDDEDHGVSIGDEDSEGNISDEDDKEDDAAIRTTAARAEVEVIDLCSDDDDDGDEGDDDDEDDDDDNDDDDDDDDEDDEDNEDDEDDDDEPAKRPAKRARTTPGDHEDMNAMCAPPKKSQVGDQVPNPPTPTTSPQKASSINTKPEYPTGSAEDIDNLSSTILSPTTLSQVDGLSSTTISQVDESDAQQPHDGPPTPNPTPKTPKSLYDIPELADRYVPRISDDGIEYTNPRKFTIKPACWRSWSASTYARFADHLRHTFDPVPFALAADLPVEEVQHVFTALVVNPLYVSNEARRRGKEGIAELFALFNKYGTPMRGWGKKADGLRGGLGELVGVKDGTVELIAHNGSKLSMKLGELSDADEEYLEETLTEDDMKTLWGEENVL